MVFPWLSSCINTAGKTLMVVLLFALILQPPMMAVAQAKGSSGSGQAVQAAANKKSLDIDAYIAKFYNRYSQNFNEFGLVLTIPDYGIRKARPAKTAREIISLASYYKYRSLDGDRFAKETLHRSVMAAHKELGKRPAYTQSFEDAIAQFLMVRMIEQVPHLVSQQERKEIFAGIKKRMGAGVSAKDTSNRAALSAAYWQYIVNYFSKNGLIEMQAKEKYDALLAKKIAQVRHQDVTESGWYLEDTPMQFNPHYHFVTAFSFLAYGELRNDEKSIGLASLMTSNLRQVTFENGMVEAKIGGRPAGLGAQFYLGVGLLNSRFGYADYGTYLSYAMGDRFFSDPTHSNRLEYHSTVAGSAPNFHDDFAFSNLAELALALGEFQKTQLTFSSGMSGIPAYSKDDTLTVVNHGSKLWVNQTALRLASGGNASTLRKRVAAKVEDIFDASSGRELSDSDGDSLDDSEEWLRGTDPHNSDSNGNGVGDGREVMLSSVSVPATDSDWGLPYGKTRLAEAALEQAEAEALRRQLQQVMPVWSIPLQGAPEWTRAVEAYIYGRYTVSEIARLLEQGPSSGAVHESIPAATWRGSGDYAWYLESL